MKLKIMTWNIAYGYGVGSEGTGDYRPLARSTYERNLSIISQVIKDEDPALVFLQEVDFDADRSQNMDQLAYISRASGILNRDEIISWDKLYVPYPGLNPSRHMGKVVSGGGILSRFPLTTIQHDLLPKPRENSRAYNFFYLSRYFQIAHVLIPGLDLPLSILNLHLEAFSKDNRELHLIKLQNRLQEYCIDLAAGDYNGAIPLEDSITKLGWQSLQPTEPTFSSVDPKEILDGFVYKKAKIKIESMKVLKTGKESDHFPVVLEVDISS